MRVVLGLAAVTAAWLGSGPAAPRQLATPPGLQWAPFLGDPTTDDSGQALAWDQADGSLVVAGISLPRAAPGQPGSYWLRRVDAQGRPGATLTIPFERGRGPTSRTHRYFGGLAPLPGGDVLTVIEMGPLRPVLVRVRPSGEIAWSKALAEHSMAIARLVPAEPGRFLVAGLSGQDAFVAKLDEHGQVLWQQRFDRGQTESFSDVAPTEYGGFVATGTTSADDPSKGTRVWVLRGGADGLRQTDVAFDGRSPALCRAGGSRYLVVYDAQKDDFAHDVRLAVLDAGLRTLDDVTLLDKQAGFPVRLGIVASQRGGFLVGGARGLGLWLARLDAQLAVAWSWADSPQAVPGLGAERIWHQWHEAFAASGDALFALSSVQNVGPAGDHLDVGLFKLTE